MYKLLTAGCLLMRAKGYFRHFYGDNLGPFFKIYILGFPEGKIGG